MGRSLISSATGGMHRRGFLRAGALTVGGLSLAQVQGVRRMQAAQQQHDTTVILLWMTGGPSHLDTYDMKPNAPAEVRGPFRPIGTNVPGLDVCELMPRHAAIADKLAVIRSLHHTYAVHDDAQHLVQTGYPQLNARQAGQRHPCQGSVAALWRGATDPDVPAYVCVPEDYRSHMGFYQAAAFLGPRYNGVNGGGDPKLGKYRAPPLNLLAGLTVERLGARRELVRVLDAAEREVERPGVYESLDESQREAWRLLLGERARRAFDLSQEPDWLRDKYGRNAWGQYTLLARRLAEAGVTFVTVNLYEKDVDWWDDHYTIEKNLRKRLPIYDQALAALVEDLCQRGLSERVLVVACGEFGRAPRIDANAGRGHWPRAMHAVLSGGGIRTGQIIGATTPDGGDPSDRPLTPGDLLASIYQVLGIDPHAHLTDRQNRPLRVIEQGEPIRELFA